MSHDCHQMCEIMKLKCQRPDLFRWVFFRQLLYMCLCILSSQQNIMDKLLLCVYIFHPKKDNFFVFCLGQFVCVFFGLNLINLCVYKNVYKSQWRNVINFASIKMRTRNIAGGSSGGGNQILYICIDHCTI